MKLIHDSLALIRLVRISGGGWRTRTSANRLKARGWCYDHPSQNYGHHLGFRLHRKT